MRPQESIPYIYAEALYRSLKEEKEELLQVEKDFQDFIATLEEAPLWKKFFRFPVWKEEKKNLVRKIFSSQVHPYLIYFLLILIDRQREYFIFEIFARFQEILDEKLSRLRAKLFLPSREYLEESYLKKIEEIIKENPEKFSLFAIPSLFLWEIQEKKELIGGFQVLVKDVLIRADVPFHFEEIRKEILKKGVLL